MGGDENILKELGYNIIKYVFIDNNCGYLCICVGLLWLIGKKSRITFFDFSDIIKKYLSCFKKAMFSNVIMKIMIYVIPFFLACIAVKSNKINDSTINIITIIISVLTGLFFMLVEVLIDLSDKNKNNTSIDANRHDHIKSLINETFYIVMYEIMNSIIILLFCFMTIFSKKYGGLDSFAIYYSSIVLILNLFIVLNRMFALVNEVTKS